MGAAEPPVLQKELKTPKRSMRERIDGRVKSLDGVDNAVRVTGKDPKRFYIWANERPLSSNTGGDVSFYANMSTAMGLEPEDGYTVCCVGEGAKAPGALSKSAGDPIVNVYGQCLMSCPLEFKKLVDAIGPSGQSGQEEADRIEKLMITRRGLDDHMRGIGRAGLFRVTADDDHGETHTIERMQRG